MNSFRYELFNDRENQLIDITVRKTLEALGVKNPDTINQSDAFAKYGRARVEKWEREFDRRGQALFNRKGLGKNSTKFTERTVLEELAWKENNIEFFYKSKKK